MKIASFFVRQDPTPKVSKASLVDGGGNENRSQKRARIASEGTDEEEIEFVGIRKKAMKEENVSIPFLTYNARYMYRSSWSPGHAV
jgi:hypothetical protein